MWPDCEPFARFAQPTAKAATAFGGWQGEPTMLAIRAFSLLAVMALGAAVVLALPGFSPNVEARTDNPRLAMKSDRLDERPIGTACSHRAWPYYEPRCLRDLRPSARRPRAVRMIALDSLSHDALAGEAAVSSAPAGAVTHLAPWPVGVLTSRGDAGASAWWGTLYDGSPCASSGGRCSAAGAVLRYAGLGAGAAGANRP
jgi:hypothetical protein